MCAYGFSLKNSSVGAILKPGMILAKKVEKYFADIFAVRKKRFNFAPQFRQKARVAHRKLKMPL